VGGYADCLQTAEASPDVALSPPITRKLLRSLPDSNGGRHLIYRGGCGFDGRLGFGAQTPQTISGRIISLSTRNSCCEHVCHQRPPSREIIREGPERQSGWQADRAEDHIKRSRRDHRSFAWRISRPQTGPRNKRLDTPFCVCQTAGRTTKPRRRPVLRELKNGRAGST
jgi:hypothetical protein